MTRSAHTAWRRVVKLAVWEIEEPPRLGGKSVAGWAGFDLLVANPAWSRFECLFEDDEGTRYLYRCFGPRPPAMDHIEAQFNSVSPGFFAEPR